MNALLAPPSLTSVNKMLAAHGLEALLAEKTALRLVSASAQPLSVQQAPATLPLEEAVAILLTAAPLAQPEQKNQLERLLVGLGAPAIAPLLASLTPQQPTASLSLAVLALIRLGHPARAAFLAHPAKTMPDWVASFLSHHFGL